ncbi:MAG: hypothetical protein QXG52_08050 [Candidatus Caldarchaeum sp.]
MPRKQTNPENKALKQTNTTCMIKEEWMITSRSMDACSQTLKHRFAAVFAGHGVVKF